MARTCQADDALEKQFEALLRLQAGPEVGLLVGKHAAKALLYGTIRTPSQEGLDPIVVTGGAGPPAGRRPKGAAALGGAAVSLEVEWITEHARQVARMLPGGLSVLGLYVFCPDSAYAAAATQLCGLLAGLAAFCLPPTSTSTTASDAPGSDAQQQLLLLHIDSTSRKQALRALPVSPPSALSLSAAAAALTAAASASSLRPLELKFGPTLGGLVLLRCWHGVDLTLTVTGGGGGADAGGSGTRAQLRRQLAALVAAEAERIRSGIFVTPGGAVPPESAPVGEALVAPSGSGVPARPAGPLQVPTFDLTFLAPPRCLELRPQQPSAEAPSSSSAQQQPQQQQQQQSGAGVMGLARLRGCLQGLAFVGKREAVGRAVADLKADLLSSLSARMDLLVEEATRLAEQEQEQGQGAQGAGASAPPHPLLSSPAQLAAGGGCDAALPRRVLLPWLGGSLALCDYLMEGEATDAAADRAQELLGLGQEQQEGAGSAGLQVVEHEMPAAAAKEGPWQPNALPGRSVSTGKAPGSSSSASSSLSSRLSCGVTMAASMAVAAVASAVGYLSLMGPSVGQ